MLVRSLQEIDLQAIEEKEENDDSQRPLETMSQALVFLQRLISLRRRQLEHLTMMRLTSPGQSEKERGLAEKFWEWQGKLGKIEKV